LRAVLTAFLGRGSPGAGKHSCAVFRSPEI
jgi:hypothetical protein